VRIWFLLLLGALSGASQGLHLDMGVVGGVPVTETLRTYQSSGRFGGFSATSATRRYVVGGTVGAQWHDRLTVQAGLQYRRYGYDYDASSFPVALQFTHNRGTGASWEIPLLAKWRLLRRSPAPYIGAGATVRRLAGLSETQTLYDNFSLNNPQISRVTKTGEPSVLQSRNAIAPTVVAGLQFRAGSLRFGPELRYTRWFSDTLGAFLQPVRWNWQQVDLLFGIGFSPGRR
jgi:hypothetical protein